MRGTKTTLAAKAPGFFDATLRKAEQEIKQLDRCLEKGREYADCGDYSGAVREFSKAASLFATEAEPHICRGLCQNKLGNYNAAIEDFTTALGLVGPQAKRFQAVCLFGRGESHLLTHNYQNAIDDLTAAIAIEPKNIIAYQIRAKAFLLAGQNDKALGDASSAIALGSTDCNMYLVRGHVYTLAGKHLKAETEYRKAVELNPKALQHIPKARREVGN